VAIIVGCMPAFTQVVTGNMGGSAFLKSLRSRLLGGSSSGGASSKVVSNEHAPKLSTFGSNQAPRRNNYYELTDTLLLKTQATIQGDESEMDKQSKPDSTHSGTERFV
jgi:hypothetical protein